MPLRRSTIRSGLVGEVGEVGDKIAGFAEGRRSVSHTGAGRAAAGELAQLSRQAAIALPGRIRDLAARPYLDWDDALDDLAAAAEQEPLLVILDEFPEIVATSPELPGARRSSVASGKRCCQY